MLIGKQVDLSINTQHRAPTMFAIINYEEGGQALYSHLTEEQADEIWDGIDSWTTNCGRSNPCTVIEHGPDATFNYVD